MILQTTLSLAAAAALINFWLSLRIVRIRTGQKILHGDGGNVALMQRMRAHSNFVEYTPIVLILIAAIELTTKGGSWLAIVGSLYMVGRVLHAFGMDRSDVNPMRMIGAAATFLTMIGLAVVAVLLALGRF